jgi:hypothetical protein
MPDDDSRLYISDHLFEDGQKLVVFKDRSGAEQSFHLAATKGLWVDEKVFPPVVLSWLPDGSWVRWDSVGDGEILSEPVAIRMLLERGETPPEGDTLRALNTYIRPTAVFDQDTQTIRQFNRSECQYWSHWDSEECPVRKTEDLAFDAMESILIPEMLFRHPNGTWTLATIHSHVANGRRFSAVRKISDEKAVVWMASNGFGLPPELCCLLKIAIRDGMQDVEADAPNAVTQETNESQSPPALGARIGMMDGQLFQAPLNDESASTSTAETEDFDLIPPATATPPSSFLSGGALSPPIYFNSKYEMGSALHTNRTLSDNAYRNHLTKKRENRVIWIRESNDPSAGKFEGFFRVECSQNGAVPSSVSEKVSKYETAIQAFRDKKNEVKQSET